MSEGVRRQPYPPNNKPPLSTTDLWISISALAVTALVGVVAAVGGLFSLAFLDYCPPESCSADAASRAVLTSLLVAVLLGVAGLTITIIRLVRRKPAWPFAIATLVVCGVALLAGFVGYITATGMANTPHQ